METIEIPNTVVLLGNNAFADCVRLRTVVLGKNLEYLKSGTFSNCGKLNKVYCWPQTPPYAENSETFFPENVMNATLYVPLNTKASYSNYEPWSKFGTITELDFEAGVGLRLFTVDGINYESFDGKTAEITGGDVSGDVVFPSSVTYEGKTYAVTTIYDAAFANNTDITSIVITEGITKISDNAFWSCENIVSAKIPNSVTTLGEYIFTGCSKLEKVELGTGITEIANNMFKVCTNLTSITIPSNVTNIGESAFESSGIESIDIPDGVTGIEGAAFAYCANLKSAKIGNGVTYIGAYAFSDCGSLESVEMGNNITSIQRSAFYQCSSLKSINLPESLNDIEAVAFSGCTALKSIEIPNSVTSIGNGAFFDCANLQTVVLGKSLGYLGYEAFSECNKLKKVYCWPQNPPTVEDPEYVFSENIKDATLYVPQNTKNSYSSTAPWSKFGTIIEQDFEVGIKDVTTESNVSITADGGTITVSGANAARVEVYTTDGQCVYSGTETTITNLPRGIYIVKAAGQSKKVTL